MSPDVSVVIPSFRRPERLSATLASVLGQVGAALEVLVVDDSDDGDGERVVGSVADRRVQYLKMPRPGGSTSGAVRNEGWARARGRWLHFLDSGDRVSDGHYAAAHKELAEHPQAQVLFGRIEPFGEGVADLDRERTFFARASKRARLAARLGHRALAAQQLFQPTLLTGSAALCRAEVVQALGGFDPGMRAADDVDFFARAFRALGAHFTDRVVVHCCVDPSSRVNSRFDLERLAPAYRRMRQKYAVAHGAAELGALRLLARGLGQVAA